MPQLNPSPWLLYLLLAWFIFLLSAPNKILGHTNLNEPNTKNTKMTKFTWTWPWQ
uniref:ATP synthase complex subunit 8 n=1 Tax=Pelophylax cf. terentievi GM87-239 TaxID=1680880 RepID=A0A0U2DYK8_9NEOB|nr:ATP synthase F0 subunit 8 [Pelophylax cf. terentievi GM87-239]AKQ19798.1 ATP synthase F0 subunit 8 [Pelophylax cf. terentievi GM87-239]